jgi:hypothetical protein
MKGAVSEFAVAFANSVTAHSTHRYDWVARRGSDSIFKLVCDLIPSASENFELASNKVC